MSIHQIDREQRMAAFCEAVKQLATNLGQTPTQNEYKTFCTSERGIPTVNQVLYDFSTWTSAVMAAGLIPVPNDPPRFEYAESQLIDEFVTIANELGRMPPLALFRKRSRFSNRPYHTRWGKWSDVIHHFATVHPQQFVFELGNLVVEDCETEQRKPLGLELPMLNEPTNEFETVALFALLAGSLGFSIISIRAAFPDALVEKDGKQMKVEFEYLTSNYLRHGHVRSEEITCICWRVDCDIAPVDVICLEDVVIQRRKMLA